jgi:hypothetical protein
MSAAIYRELQYLIQCDGSVVEVVVVQSLICTLLSWGFSWEEIYPDIVPMYGANATRLEGVSYCWRQFQTGLMNIKDTPQSERPATSNTQKNAQRVCDVICADQRKKLQEASTEWGISHAIILNIVHDVIHYWKTSEPWVPKCPGWAQREIRALSYGVDLIY